MAKPYDRNFKVTGQKDARGHLYVFAGVPLDDSIEVQPVDKDLSVPGFLVDDCYIVKDKNGSSVKHLEAELRWHTGIPRDMGRYMQALDLKLELHVDSVLLLLTQAGVPDPIPDHYRIKLKSLAPLAKPASGWLSFGNWRLAPCLNSASQA